MRPVLPVLTARARGVFGASARCSPGKSHRLPPTREGARRQGMETTPPRMPAAFLGHGSPMNALESTRYTAAWRAFGASVPKPRAVLVVSAHWYIHATAVT